MLKINIFRQYKVIDMENFIFNHISQNCFINKTKLFDTISKEHKQPSKSIVNLTKHYNLFNNIFRIFVIFILVLLFMYGSSNMLLIGLNLFMLIGLLIYQYYIDKKFYDICNEFILKLT